MLSRLTYPVTTDDVREKTDGAIKLFTKKKLHPGAFIGLALLEGAYDAEEPESLYADIKHGEKLALKTEKQYKKLKNPPLCAFRSDGTELGALPFTSSLIPNKLLSLGYVISCYVEACSFQAGMLDIAVSVYCDGKE